MFPQLFLNEVRENTKRTPMPTHEQIKQFVSEQSMFAAHGAGFACRFFRFDSYWGIKLFCSAEEGVYIHEGQKLAREKWDMAPECGHLYPYKVKGYYRTLMHGYATELCSVLSGSWGRCEAQGEEFLQDVDEMYANAYQYWYSLQDRGETDFGVFDVHDDNMGFRYSDGKLVYLDFSHTTLKDHYDDNWEVRARIRNRQ